MHFLAEYGIFLLKTVTLVIAILITIGVIMALVAKTKLKDKEIEKGKLFITKLNEKYEEMAAAINKKILTKTQFKHLSKIKKAEIKEQAKQKKSDKPRLFVINFYGDLRASAVNNLREEITGILLTAKSNDEVLLRLESPGGMVNSYGLAASQLKRLKNAEIKLTIAIDKMAASGGYMMACVGHYLIAAPFAIIGSVGVVTQLPNFNRWLKKRNIEFEQITAGEYKRTLTVFGQNTSKDRKKVQEEVNDAHELFKSFIEENRPIVNLAEIATGEHWFAARAFDYQLIDKLQTSDDFLIHAKDKYDIYEVQYKMKKPFSKRIAIGFNNLYEKIITS